MAQTVQGRQQLFVNDLRTNAITANELASELDTTFAGSTMVTNVDDAAAACTAAGATDLGIEFTIATLDADGVGGVAAADYKCSGGCFYRCCRPR